MSWKMQDKEFNSVSALPAPDRYSYFVKKVADFETLWSLWSEGGWALASDDLGHQTIPVWPHERYASSCSSGDWVGYSPKEINLKEWIDRWIPGIIHDQRSVVVFPTQKGKGVVVSPERIKNDLEQEITLYE